MKWEFLKIKVKEFSVQYSINKNKQLRQSASDLKDELNSLENKYNLNDEERKRQQEILN